MTNIADGAFTGENGSPKTVLIPEGTTVGNGAFDADKTGQLTYKETTDGEGNKEVEITGYTGNGTSVEIPAEIGGKPVTQIADDAFANTNLEEISVPETVKTDTSGGVGGNTTAEVSQDMGGGITMKTKTVSGEMNVTITESGTVTEPKNAKNVPASITNAKFTYERTLVKPGATDMMYTVCLPYTPATDGNRKFYTLTSAKDDVLTFTQVTTPAAYTPYLVVVSADCNVGVTDQTVDLSTAISSVGGTNATNGYQLCGTLRGMTHDEAVAAGAYILQNDGKWKKVTDNGEDKKNAYIPPFRAYIVKTAGGAGARLYTEFSDDDATGINRVNAGTDSEDAIYTLDGRRLDRVPSQKGIYIKNGKKRIVK